MKIVFLGDSLTWGGYGGDFVAEIQQRLPGHEIVNAGLAGSTVIYLLRAIDDVLEEEPDGVFVMVGGNDAISNLYPQTRSYYERAQGVPGGVVTPQQFAQHYRDLLTRLQVAQVLTWVGLPAVEYSPALVGMMQQYNALAREAAESLNIPVTDVFADLRPDHIPDRPPLTLNDIHLIGQRTRTGWSDYESERLRGGFTFTFDGLHPTPAAARHLAGTIIDSLDVT